LEERLVDLMVEYKDMDTAYKAVNMIRALGYKDAYRIFTAVLKGDDALRGIRACAGMAAIGAKDAIPLIEECKEKWRRSRSFGRAADAALETLKKDDPKKGEMKKE
jgi:hypothetical protein